MLHQPLLVLLMTASAVLAQNCQLCPDGAAIGNPDKPFFGAEGISTCASFDFLLAPVPDASCEGILATLNTDVDLRVYCECPGFQPTGVCEPLCGGADVVNPDTPIDQFGFSCGEIADIVNSAVNETACSALDELEFFCCDRGGNDTSSNCTICGEGSEIGLPDRPIPFLGDAVTCGVYEEVLSFIPEEFCVVVPFGVNMATFCGCTGAEPLPDEPTCPFCGDEGVFDPTLELEIDFLNVTLSCADIAELAQYVVDEELCQLVIASNIDVCCRAAASDVPSLAPIMASDVNSTCGVCFDGSDVQEPEKVIYYVNYADGGNPTCAEWDSYLRSLPEEQCQVIVDMDPVNTATFCGCDGATLPNVCGPLCPVDEAIADPDLEVSFSNNATDVTTVLTCEQADDLALFVRDPQFCSDNVPIFPESCCVPVEEAAPVASPVAAEVSPVAGDGAEEVAPSPSPVAASPPEPAGSATSFGYHTYPTLALVVIGALVSAFPC